MRVEARKAISLLLLFVTYFFFGGFHVGTMDDVQYLLESAKEESYLFVVDSRMRDTAVHPTPSEYEISFSSPFRNVFGMDILDATIARTEYIVESNTNVLEYALGQPASLAEWNAGAWALGRKRTVAMDPGDYNLPQFVESLNAKLQAVAAAAGEPALKCAPTTNPSEISNKIAFTCSSPFTLLMANSTLRHTLGFGDPVTSTTAADYAAVPGWSVNRTGGASDAFLSKATANLPDVDPASATLGPVPAASMTKLEPVYAGRVLRQHFESAATGPASQVLTYAVGVSADVPPALTVRVRRASDDAIMASGTLQVDAYDPNDVYVPNASALTDGGHGVLVAGQAYYVEYTATGGSATDYVGVYYNEDNLPVSGQRYVELDGVAVHPGENLCCDVVTSSWGHAAWCPGVVNLSGPRYVNIRCPEIESHMFRDRVNEACHAGLGMVKLRGYGFREQRYDFVSFPPRRFHPLGKLSKLTFRLERPDGSLYDSHGVDHTLLLVLRYYSLPAAAKSADGAAARQTPLAPQYTPDLRQYMIQTRWADEARATDYTVKRYGP